MDPKELDVESRENKTAKTYLLKIFLILFSFFFVCETNCDDFDVIIHVTALLQYYIINNTVKYVLLFMPSEFLQLTSLHEKDLHMHATVFTARAVHAT